MEYYLFRATTNQYVGVCNGQPVLAAKKEQMHRFSSRVKAENFLQNNFINQFGKMVAITEMEIRPCDEYLSAVNGQAENVELEKIEEQLNQLPDLVNQLLGILRMVPNLTSFYAEQVDNANKAQQDFLHKIELSNANAADEFKLYKGLQEVRQYRRKCKDYCDLLKELEVPGVMLNLNALQGRLAKYTDHLQNRRYCPRLLDELFDAETGEDLNECMNGLTKKMIKGDEEKLGKIA